MTTRIRDRVARLELCTAPRAVWRISFDGTDSDLRLQLAAVAQSGRLGPHRVLFCVPCAFADARAWEREACASQRELEHDEAAQRHTRQEARPPEPARAPTPRAAPEQPPRPEPLLQTHREIETDRRAYAANVALLSRALRRR